MFRYAPQGIVFWPITLTARNPDTGELIDGIAHVQYSLLSRNELKAREKRLTSALMSGLSSMNANAIAGPNAGDVQKLSEEVDKLTNEHDEELIAHVHGWKGITDANDKDLPFDEATLRAMLNDPLLYESFSLGLIAASKGAKAKNSSPGPAGTPARGQK